MFGKTKKQKRKVPEGCQVVRLESRKKDIPVRLLSRVVFVFVVTIFFVACGWVMFFSPYMQVNSISLEGVETLSGEDVLSSSKGIYEGKYFGFLPKNNLLLFPERKMETILKQNFRKISEINVERIFPNGARIKLKERDSLLVWCSGGPCYIIDENGYAYTGADFESPEIAQNNLIVVTNVGAKPVDLGEQVLKSEYIDFIINARHKLLGEQSFDMSGECFTPSALAEEVSCKTKDGVNISLSMTLPLEETMKTLALFMKKELSADAKAQLEYLDLRFENRVYYKLKGENPEEQGDSESMVAGEETSKQETEENKQKTEKANKKKQ